MIFEFSGIGSSKMLLWEAAYFEIAAQCLQSDLFPAICKFIYAGGLKGEWIVMVLSQKHGFGGVITE